MSNDAIWDEFEVTYHKYMERVIPENIPYFVEFFQELRDRNYTFWLTPKIVVMGFTVNRGKALINFVSLHIGKFNFDATLKGKYYYFHGRPIALKTEICALLDMLIAQPEEGDLA